MAYKIDYSNASSEDLVAAVGQRLDDIRLARNLTRAELAQQTGVSVRTLTRLAAGHSVSLDTFVRVLKALGLSDNLTALLPDPSVRPIERVRLGGGERQRARQRQDATPTPWQWGDEEA